MATNQKRKRVSKKNKKSWRKNVDITDVDDFLEDQRLDERLGGTVREKADHELFAIDTTGEDLATLPSAPKETVKRKSMRLRETTTPKCFALLERRSAVPDPVIKRNHIKIKEKPIKVKPGATVAKLKKNKKPGTLPQVRFHQIWSEEDKTRELGGLATWLTADAIRHTLQNTGYNKKKRPRDIRKPSPLDAVEAPHPGMSYNPTLTDHRQLLQSVAETEAAIEKKEKHIERVTTKMFRKIPREEAEKSYITEMSAGLDDGPDSSAEMGDYSTVNPPVQRKKKTLKTRRKARENRELMLKLKAQKLEKRKRSDVNERLAQLKCSIEKKEALSLEYQERKKIREESKIGDTKSLGPTKFEVPPLEFVSPNEMKGSLRQLEPTGSILADRYSSLQKRNILEPTRKRNIRTPKIKRFVKASVKMGWEPQGF